MENNFLNEPLDSDNRIGNQTIKPMPTPDVMPKQTPRMSSGLPVEEDGIINPIKHDRSWYETGGTNNDVLIPDNQYTTKMNPPYGGPGEPRTLPPKNLLDSPYETRVENGTTMADILAEQQNNQPAVADLSGIATPTYDTPTPVGYTGPTQQQVQDNELVKNQLNDLISSDSDYINIAEQAALRQANSRGLTNSSIAAGAGREAAIKQALPIAQQDAKTYFDTNTNNTNWTNRFGENAQNAGYNLQRDATQAGYANDQARLNAEYTAQRDAANAGYQRDNTVLQGQIADSQLGRQHAMNMDRDQANFGYNQSTIQLQGDIAANQAALLQGFNLQNLDVAQRNALETQALEFANVMEQNRMKVAADYTQSYLNSQGNIMELWNAEAQAIYQNGNMTAAEQRSAVNALKDKYQTMLNNDAAMYQAMGAWGVMTDVFPPNGSSPAPDNPNGPDNPDGPGDTPPTTGDPNPGSPIIIPQDPAIGIGNLPVTRPYINPVPRGPRNRK